MQPEAFEGGLDPVAALRQLSHLTALSLRESPVLARHLPRWMPLDSLVAADLSRCELQRVPPCLYAASALQHLNLARNRISRMPAVSQVRRIAASPQGRMCDGPDTA